MPPLISFQDRGGEGEPRSSDQSVEPKGRSRPFGFTRPSHGGCKVRARETHCDCDPSLSTVTSRNSVPLVSNSGRDPLPRSTTFVNEDSSIGQVNVFGHLLLIHLVFPQEP